MYKSQLILETKAKKGTLGKEERTCLRCNQAFTKLKSELGQFCSKECRYRHLSENKGEMLIKQEATNLEKYGVKNHMRNKEIVSKMRETVKSKYPGKTEHPRFSKEASAKRLATCIEKYGVPYAPSFQRTSQEEDELADYIRDLLPNELIERANRTLLEGKEVDIYIPSKQIAIEYDGLYYHSESRIPDSKYHLNKTEALAEKGIRLIHIFSDEWNYKKEVVKRRLKDLLGLREERVYARKCIIKELSKQEAGEFLNEVHIQGADTAKIRLGLVYEKELVAVMTFTTGRAVMGSSYTPDVYELSRFAGKNVVGGASKLLAHFIRQYNPSEIYSYADRRWSVGTLYETLGFTKTSVSKPSYWYTADYRARLYRYNFRKSVLVEAGAPEDKTEREIMKELGYDRIWDCGTIKYTLKVAY